MLESGIMMFGNKQCFNQPSKDFHQVGPNYVKEEVEKLK